MQNAMVPLLVIRTDTQALIQINGNLIGISSPNEHVAMPISSTGEYFICAIPLSDDEDVKRYSITRRIEFEEGRLLPVLAPDVSLCVWPGGLYEVMLVPGTFHIDRHGDVPYTLSRVKLPGNRPRTVTLYYDGGLRLAIEESGVVLAGYSLGQGERGSLDIVNFSGEPLIYVKTESSCGERMLLLKADFSVALDISGYTVEIAGNIPASIEKLGTSLGHERRIRYDYMNGEFIARAEEIGFFTHIYVRPSVDLMLAVAFVEAIREGLFEEAYGYMTKELSSGLDLLEVREFIGAFDACRPPLSDMSGKILGLISMKGEKLSHARLMEFEFEKGLISNMGEL